MLLNITWSQVGVKKRLSAVRRPFIIILKHSSKTNLSLKLFNTTEDGIKANIQFQADK